MQCPHCHSYHIQSVPVQNQQTTVSEKTKGFGFCKGCIGFALFGWWGWLCGLCGMGKSKRQVTTHTHTHISYICLDCGTKFSK